MKATNGHAKAENGNGAQGKFVGLIWEPFEYPFRLRANDIIRIDGRLCRVLRVNYSAAVVLMNQPRRKFTTRFDKPVSFQPSPSTFRISPNSEVEILKSPVKQKRKPKGGNHESI